MRFELASHNDEPDLRRLLRETRFPGEIELSLEREPCIEVANAIEGELHQTLVAKLDDARTIAGMGTRTLALRYVNGVPMRVGYLGQLRVAPAHRASPTLLRHGYAKLKELHADGRTDFYVTTIVADNMRARRVLEAGLPGMPRYRHVDDLVTLTMPARGRGLERVAVVPQPVTDQDLPQIVSCLARNGARFQFAPVWTLADLRSATRTPALGPGDFVAVRRDGHIAGCVACWDQRAFKQAVVRGYSARLARLRYVSSLLGGFLGIPKLPAVGAPVALAYLSHLAVDDDDLDVTMALIDAARALAASRRIDYVSLGLSARHPLLARLRTQFAARTYASRVYVVSWPDGAQAVRALDSRPTHLEVAIL